METLPTAPEDAAGGSLNRTVKDAGWDDEVRFLDDLSCGPIRLGRGFGASGLVGPAL